MCFPQVSQLISLLFEMNKTNNQTTARKSILKTIENTIKDYIKTSKQFNLCGTNLSEVPLKESFKIATLQEEFKKLLKREIQNEKLLGNSTRLLLLLTKLLPYDILNK